MPAFRRPRLPVVAALAVAVAMGLGGCTGAAGGGAPSPGGDSASATPSTETVRPGECPQLFLQLFAENYGAAPVAADTLPTGMAMPADPAPSCVLSADPAPVPDDAALSTRPWIVVYFGADAAARAEILVAIEQRATSLGYTATPPDPARSQLPDGAVAAQYSSPAAPDGTGFDLQVLGLSPSGQDADSSIVVIGAETGRT